MAVNQQKKKSLADFLGILSDEEMRRALQERKAMNVKLLKEKFIRLTEGD